MRTFRYLSASCIAAAPAFARDPASAPDTAGSIADGTLAVSLTAAF